MKKFTRNFECSYLGNGYSDFLQIESVVGHTQWLLLQNQLDKRSGSYMHAKIVSIYPQCGQLTSWVALTVCLDLGMQSTIQGKIIARMEWPIKPKFGQPFLKLHCYKAEVFYPSAVQSTSLLGGSGGTPPREFLQNKHSEVKSESTFNCLTLNLIHIHFTVIFL